MSSSRRFCRDEAPGPLPWARRDLVFLALCLLLALGLRLGFFGGVHAIDDFNYLRHAAEVWKGRFDYSSVSYWHGMRGLVFLPVSGAFALFGVSELSAVLWPLLASLLTVALVFRVGLMLHGRAAGMLAALVAAYLPLTVHESTRVLPGPIMSLLIAASTYLFLRGELGAGRRRWWFFLSGGVFGLMPWTGHLGLVFGLFFVSALLCRRHPILAYWPVAVGAVALVGMGTLHQWLAAHNPFVNLDIARVVLSNEMATPKPLYYARLLFWPHASHGGTLYLAGLGALAAVTRRHRAAVVTTVWLVLTYFVLEFGSSSVTEYRPLFKQARYLTVIAVPGALLVGIGLAEARSWIAARRWGGGVRPMIVVGLLVLTTFASSMVTLDRLAGWGREQRAQLRRVARLVEEHRGEMVYNVHWLWNTRVGFFLDYDDPYFPSGYTPYHAVNLATADPESWNQYIQTLAPGDPMPSGILLLDEVLLDHSIGPRRIGLVGPGEIPPVLADPPASWRLIERVASLAVYDIPPTVWPGPEASPAAEPTIPSGP